jgi:hypothetical protein
MHWAARNTPLKPCQNLVQQGGRRHPRQRAVMKRRHGFRARSTGLSRNACHGHFGAICINVKRALALAALTPERLPKGTT